MRKASIARLSLLLLVALIMMAAPSRYSVAVAFGDGFPTCPWESCDLHFSICEESGGVASFSHYEVWCQDENFYLRSHGIVHCTTAASVECAAW